MRVSTVEWSDIRLFSTTQQVLPSKLLYGVNEVVRSAIMPKNVPVLLALSKAFLKSMKPMYKGLYHSEIFSAALLSLR